MDRQRQATSRRLQMTKRGRGAGVAACWSGTTPCGRWCWGTCSRVGPRSRWQATWRGKPVRPVISHETIYRFIYGQIARTKEYKWRHFLPRAKSKRGWRGRRGGSPASFIAQRRPLAERPQAAADRQTPGHWEADLMLFGRSGQAVLTLHERHSRLLIAARQPGKAAEPIASAMCDLLALVPPDGRRTVTFDNGTEFARHYRLHDLGMQTFFCDTHSPWQKGGIENAIGRMRRMLPRKTDLATVTEERFAQLVQAYNHTPRKCLGYQTPAEVFINQVLHLKCESTFPLSRE